MGIKVFYIIFRLNLAKNYFSKCQLPTLKYILRIHLKLSQNHSSLLKTHQHAKSKISILHKKLPLALKLKSPNLKTSLTRDFKKLRSTTYSLREQKQHKEKIFLPLHLIQSTCLTFLLFPKVKTKIFSKVPPKLKSKI